MAKFDHPECEAASLLAVESSAQMSELSSGVLTSPAEEMLAEAIAEALSVPAERRAGLFADRVATIESFMVAHPGDRSWSCKPYRGSDGSHIFRGGHGHSLVIDPAGRLWRARSYEDFDTTYTITGSSCEIASLTPHYETMREYLPR